VNKVWNGREVMVEVDVGFAERGQRGHSASTNVLPQSANVVSTMIEHDGGKLKGNGRGSPVKQASSLRARRKLRRAMGFRDLSLSAPVSGSERDSHELSDIRERRETKVPTQDLVPPCRWEPPMGLRFDHSQTSRGNIQGPTWPMYARGWACPHHPVTVQVIAGFPYIHPTRLAARDQGVLYPYTSMPIEARTSTGTGT